MGNEGFWAHEHIGIDRARDMRNIGSGIYLRLFEEREFISNGNFCCFFCLKRIDLAKRGFFVGIPTYDANNKESERRVIYLDKPCYHLVRMGEFSPLIDAEPDER